MADEKKSTAAKKDRKKPEPRPAYVGVRVKGQSGLTKNDIEIVFASRKLNTILEAVTAGEEGVVVLPIKID